MFGLEPALFALLVICLVAACAFEFINGFHDTANAVATVIYTNSLKPTPAVIWSGICNATGVLVGGITVAMGIVELLPPEVQSGSNTQLALLLILSMLTSAIIWNLLTWYLGIPCSSSHTLVGSIIGVGLAFSMTEGREFGSGVNWSKSMDIGLSLLVSPLFGFTAAALLLMASKWFIKDKVIFEEADPKKVPPFWIRSILILTCTGVSFAHGNNDGQKGIGLLMLILITAVPSYFVLNNKMDYKELPAIVQRIETQLAALPASAINAENEGRITAMKAATKTVLSLTSSYKMSNMESIPAEERPKIRQQVVTILRNFSKAKIADEDMLKAANNNPTATLKASIDELSPYTDYAPVQISILVSLCLGIGTMIGYKRIVVTIGEKIGKSHMSYAQGASAELIASSTILMASQLGLPVSTTHVLSSGIAGTMVASDGTKNLQGSTLTNIGLAWVLTLPVTIGLSVGFFFLFRVFLL
ncbi:MAG: anion permease [Cytophagales bacterium]|nr:MAG: anion permease [Runella slithyformis]TAF35810.1 MAG: anion permease [Cytophagales bacterium]TAF62385.1 MAG: anion permease [Cytophagales bacterium]